MSRISDTRVRTREAAAQLVNTGRAPHEITVDLIYAEIKQGSRTTINDELKLWKDEQAKAHAMNATLPPLVADAFTRIWATAIEHGELAFLQQREEIEQQLRQVQEASKLEVQHCADLGIKLNELTAQLHAASNVADLERQQKERAIQEWEQIKTEFADMRITSALLLEQEKNKSELRISELQFAMQKQEQNFAQQREQTTERLESVQKHVMLQVDEARVAQKRAEQECAALLQRNAILSKQLQQTHIDTSLLQQQVTGLSALLATTETALQAANADRTALTQQLASTNAIQAVSTELLEMWQSRAIKAEEQLSGGIRPKRLQGRRRSTGKAD